MKYTALRLVVGMLVSQCLACRRMESQGRNAPVQAGPNALRQGAQQPATGPGVRLAVGVTEGRVKPPADKPNDDEERYRVRPEWYPNGQPDNPYPAGTMIPINPPAPGMQPVP